MLANSLTKMVDKTECIFFLNTPNSINYLEAVGYTNSAWIYYELTVSKLIRKRNLKDYRIISINESTKILNLIKCK